MIQSIYTIYSKEYDITIIMEDILNEREEFVSTEVKGFYFGPPDEQSNKDFYGDLKAEF